MKLPTFVWGLLCCWDGLSGQRNITLKFLTPTPHTQKSILDYHFPVACSLCACPSYIPFPVAEQMKI
jgi:hypothetical protein